MGKGKEGKGKEGVLRELGQWGNYSREGKGFWGGGGWVSGEGLGQWGNGGTVILRSNSLVSRKYLTHFFYRRELPPKSQHINNINESNFCKVFL